MKHFLLGLALSTSLVAAPKEKPQVVLIHGIINHRSMSTFNRLLKKDGWDVENYKYSTRSQTIQEHGAALAKRLKEVARDDKPMNFIAFSLGGLVLRAALNHPDCPKEALKNGKIILISSPQNGSETARKIAKVKLGRLILGKHAGRQLAETAPGGFDHLGPFPEHMKMLILSGTFDISPLMKDKSDSIVTIKESCLSRPHSHKLIPASHKWITNNIDTIHESMIFIEEDHPADNCPLRHK